MENPNSPAPDPSVQPDKPPTQPNPTPFPPPPQLSQNNVQQVSLPAHPETVVPPAPEYDTDPFDAPKQHVVTAKRLLVLFLTIFIPVGIVGLVTPVYEVASSASAIFLYGGLAGALAIGVVTGLETLHKLQQSSRVATQGDTYTLPIILSAIASLVFPPFLLLLVFAIYKASKQKQNAGEPTQIVRQPTSKGRAILLAILAFVGAAGSLAVVVFIGSIFLSLRACDLSGSSKCF